MTNKVEWLDREAVTLPNYCLCLNNKQYQSALDLFNIDHKYRTEFTGKSKGATCHTIYKDGYLRFIVCFDCQTTNLAEIVGILAHEATHIWQDYRKHIGEKKPSAEFEAMSIQCIVQELFASFMRQTKRKYK